MKSAARTMAALAAISAAPVIPSITPSFERKNALPEGPSLAEVKKAFQDLNLAVDELKKKNEERLSAIEKGNSTAKYDEQLARMNAAIDKHEKLQTDYIEAQKKRDEALKELERKWEARMNRKELSGGGEDPEKAEKEQLARKAYDSYLRRGAERLSDDEKKVLLISNDTTGGYLAPPTWVMDIIKAEVLYSPMRELVTVRKIGTSEMKQPKRTGTAAATRVGETSTRAETQNPSWGMLTIPAPEMYAEARISQQNLEDSAYDLEQFVADEFSEQFGVKEGQEVISGNGVGQCLGILDPNAAGPSTPIAFTVSGSAATIAGGAGVQGDGIVNLFHAVKTAYAQRARWILNRGSLGKVRLLKDTTGQYLWQPGLVPQNPNSILGAPYTETPDMPDEGANTFPIAFGDWKRAYVMVERIEIAMVRDPLTLASVGQVKFTGRRRVGGQVVLGEAIRLLKCSV